MLGRYGTAYSLQYSNWIEDMQWNIPSRHEVHVGIIGLFSGEGIRDAFIRSGPMRHPRWACRLTVELRWAGSPASRNCREHLPHWMDFKSSFSSPIFPHAVRHQTVAGVCNAPKHCVQAASWSDGFVLTPVGETNTFLVVLGSISCLPLLFIGL